ncbi:hypothetical protein [Bradyrhizobium sp. Leo121]|uniref:hypothetical protein n=1 Tax=Bradyrhizobium sp. Leo121 TaxID=1571195 RepID=UPI00102975CC|nr:hypothetical protein [Bradyrhizobium sp. Leo121]RZN36001.1 hypothetical protein CWO90_02115 [Bradyrhizobium sp. Leo121]
MSDHIRNTGPMLASPRCGAKTRTSGACRSPAVHGLFTKDAIAERRQIQALLGEARKLLEEMK